MQLTCHDFRPCSGSVLALVVLAASSAASPQALPGPDSDARFRTILERIEDETARNGADSDGLIAPFTLLGLLYEERGELVPAGGAYEQARHLTRVNHGLHSLEQAPLLRQSIRIEQARGNHEQAWRLEQELVAVARRHRGELETYTVFRELAEKRLTTLERYRAGALPPQIVLGCYYARRPPRPQPARRVYEGNKPSCRSGSRETVVLSLLVEARSYQTLAVDALLESGRYAGDSLRSLLADVLRTHHRLGDPYVGLVMRRLLAYEPADARESRRRAEILIAAADLNVLRAHRIGRSSPYASALDQCREAYVRLVESGAERESIEALFAPAIPVVLPATEASPFDPDEAPAPPTAFIDVAFDVTQEGRSDNIAVLPTTTNAPRSARRELVRRIKRTSFRPRFVDGRVADGARVVVRRHLSERRD